MDNICRLCMSNIQCDKLKIPLFQEQSPKFVHILVTLLGFHINFDDGLPSHICIACSEAATEAHKFKKKCIDSNDLLWERLQRENESLLPPNEQNDDSLHEDDPEVDCEMREDEDIEIEEIDVKKECELSKLYFSCEADHIEHEKTTHAFEKIEIDHELFLCDICNYKTNSKLDFNVHNRKNHSNSWQCIKCDYKTSDKFEQIEHQKVHSQDNPFQCNVCHRKFKTLSVLRQHVSLHFENKPKFQCKVCNGEFRLQISLKKHMVMHSQEKPFQCNLCNRKFKMLCHLKQHMVAHSQEKPFQCKMCHSEFRTLCHLKQHMPMHMEDRPFQCNVCHEPFKMLRNLTKHMVKHLDKKTLACDICTFKTTNKKILITHIKAHAKE